MSKCISQSRFERYALSILLAENERPFATPYSVLGDVPMMITLTSSGSEYVS